MAIRARRTTQSILPGLARRDFFVRITSGAPAPKRLLPRQIAAGRVAAMAAAQHVFYDADNPAAYNAKEFLEAV
ncbi:MAG: hypothetical protein EXQ86_11840 [Rhodospirillales bacterium]|nr:hypothetical protein [Rhodospirillales bacterium]